MPKERHAQKKKREDAVKKAANEKAIKEQAVREQIAAEKAARAEADLIKKSELEKAASIEKEIALKKYEDQQKKNELISKHFHNYLLENNLSLAELNCETQQKLWQKMSDRVNREEQLKKQEAAHAKDLLEKEAARVKELLEKEAIRVKNTIEENLKIKSHIKDFLEKNHIPMEDLEFKSTQKLVIRSRDKVKYDEETCEIEKYLENQKKFNQRFEHNTNSCGAACNICKIHSIAEYSSCWYDERMQLKIESRKNPSFFHSLFTRNNPIFSVDSSEFHREAEREAKINNELRTINGTVVYNFTNSLYLEENKPVVYNFTNSLYLEENKPNEF